MFVSHVMSGNVISVRADESVRAAIARMTEADVGSVAVCDGSRLVGIFTERDVLRIAAEDGFQERAVAEVMTRNPVTVSPDVHVADAARLMGERRIRHLPVVEGENLYGIVGIRDVLGNLVESVWRAHDETAHDTARELLRPR